MPWRDDRKKGSALQVVSSTAESEAQRDEHSSEESRGTHAENSTRTEESAVQTGQCCSSTRTRPWNY